MIKLWPISYFADSIYAQYTALVVLGGWSLLSGQTHCLDFCVLHKVTAGCVWNDTYTEKSYLVWNEFGFFFNSSKTQDRVTVDCDHFHFESKTFACWPKVYCVLKCFTLNWTSFQVRNFWFWVKMFARLEVLLWSWIMYSIMGRDFQID